MRLRAERRQRVGDGVGDDAGDRDDATFAGAFGAQRIGRRRLRFERDGADAGEVARGRQQVIGERAGEQLSFAVIDEVLEKRAAEPLHDRAHGLPVEGRRIDDAADILDGYVVEQRDMAGLGIDRHVRRVRTVAVGALVARVGRLGRDACEARERQRLAARTAHRARLDLDGLGVASELLRRGGGDGLAQHGRRRDDGVAAHHHRA